MRHRRRGDDRTTPPSDASGDGRTRRPEPLVGKSGRRARAAAPPPEPKKRGKRGKRSDAARHPLVIGLSFVFLLVIFAVVGGVAALVFGRSAYYAPGPLEETVQIDIPRGAGLGAIADALEQQKIISSGAVFIGAAYATGATRAMKAGEYVVPAHASMADIMAKIVSGEVVQHQVTFAEGLTSAQIVKRLNEMNLLTGTIREIPDEGSLLPETYAITRGTRREQIIERMKAAHDKALADVWANRDPDLPLSSPEELVVLASIVEKETGVAPERERVAAVFVNRLNRKMKLQSDPTILYGLYGGVAWEEGRTIFRSDFDRPNPYNTYQIAALPPGPIANPGVAALKATANPADTDELYFVADGTGGHVFSKSYEEHQANVARWREVERQRGTAGGTTQ